MLAIQVIRGSVLQADKRVSLSFDTVGYIGPIDSREILPSADQEGCSGRSQGLPLRTDPEHSLVSCCIDDQEQCSNQLGAVLVFYRECINGSLQFL